LDRCAAALDQRQAAMAAIRRKPAVPAQGSIRASEDEPRVLVDQPRLCALWKPPGWAVDLATTSDDRSPRRHGGPSLPLRDWLAERFGAEHPIALEAASSHGLVHRLDRDTSGVILWAKNNSGLLAARMQFGARRVQKQYVCVCHGHVSKTLRMLDAPLREYQNDFGAARSEVAEWGKPARTEILAVSHMSVPRPEDPGALEHFSLVEVSLGTGRLHQIRAHLSHEGHPLVGDIIYGSGSTFWCERLFLHSYRLSIDIGDGPLDVLLPLPEDLQQSLGRLSRPTDSNSELVDKWLKP